MAQEDDDYYLCSLCARSTLSPERCEHCGAPIDPVADFAAIVERYHVPDEELVDLADVPVGERFVFKFDDQACVRLAPHEGLIIEVRDRWNGKQFELGEYVLALEGAGTIRVFRGSIRVKKVQ